MSAGRPKATSWCHSRAVGQRTDKVRLAPKLCTAPSTCLRATMIYFYCRRRPSRPHVKHLNSSPPLLTHAIILGSWARILCVNISSHAAFGVVGIVELYLLTLTKGLQNPLMERLHMQWPRSIQRGTLPSRTQLHTALHPEKVTWSMIHSSSFSSVLISTR